jgi:hypothetical protein
MRGMIQTQREKRTGISVGLPLTAKGRRRRSPLAAAASHERRRGISQNTGPHGQESGRRREEDGGRWREATTQREPRYSPRTRRWASSQQSTPSPAPEGHSSVFAGQAVAARRPKGNFGGAACFAAAPSAAGPLTFAPTYFATQVRCQDLTEANRVG